MIVSGGKILGIHRVEHDLTFSGDGVRTPLGLDHGLLEEIHDTSAKLDKSAFESWSAQTENWDIEEYTGGDGIKVDDHEISVSAKYLTSGDLETYAKSGWVEENFLNKADYREYSEGNDYVRIDNHKIYGYDWTSAVSGVPFKLDASAFEQYSAWANGTYLKDEALKPYATSAGLDENQQYAMTNSGWAPVDIPDDTVISGTSGISVQKIGDTWVVGTSAQYATSAWVQGALDKKQDVSAMSAYATSAWVEENFSKLTLTVSYDAQSEELHLDFSPAPTDYVLIGDRWYHYVQIGDQLWIDENLDYKFAYDGGTLPIGASGTPSTPSAWYYGNDEATYGVDGNRYGLLYNWYAAKYLEDNKSTLLPEGWRVPSGTDWDTLATAVGGADTAGTILKSAAGWTDGAGTDDYGFSGVPAGQYHPTFGFAGLGSFSFFWTTDEGDDSSTAFSRCLSPEASLSGGISIKIAYYSIRLVKSLT